MEFKSIDLKYWIRYIEFIFNFCKFLGFLYCFFVLLVFYGFYLFVFYKEVSCLIIFKLCRVI